MTDRLDKRLRKTGRVIGVIAAGFWLLALVLSAIGGQEESAAEGPLLSAEGVLLGVLVLLASIGVWLEFKNERFGGMVTLVAGCGLALFALATAGHNHLFAVLISGSPFIVSGSLVLAGTTPRGHRSGPNLASSGRA